MYRECWECPRRACFMAAALPLPFFQPLQAIHVACYLLPAFYLPYHAPWPCSKCPNCKPERWKPLFQERWEGIIITGLGSMSANERRDKISVMTCDMLCCWKTTNTMFSNMGFTFQFSHDFFWDICVWCGKMRIEGSQFWWRSVARCEAECSRGNSCSCWFSYFLASYSQDWVIACNWFPTSCGIVLGFVTAPPLKGTKCEPQIMDERSW